MAIVYQIKMGTGYALSIDKNTPHAGGQLILAGSNPSDHDQQWVWVFYPQSQASILYNPARNLFAAPANIQQGAGILLFNLASSYGSSNTWQVFQSSAVRPPANTDLNMNALGNSWGPETKIGLWSWSGGAPNEVWTSTLV